MQSYQVDLGKMTHEDMHRYQLEWVHWQLQEKERSDIFVVLEHPPVFTIGSIGISDSMGVTSPGMAINSHLIWNTSAGFILVV
jgi:lipoate-protein ligase B